MPVIGKWLEEFYIPIFGPEGATEEWLAEHREPSFQRRRSRYYRDKLSREKRKE